MSKSARNCAFAALTAIASLLPATASAELTRGAAAACIKRYYGITDVAQQEGDAFVQGAAEEPAGQFVNDAALRTGVAYKIKVVTCEESPNANAFYSKEKDNLPPDFTNENYVLFNKKWVTEKLGSEELTFVLGHELAHITNNHDTTRQDLKPVEKELEADYSGGCYVARMRGSTGPMETFLRRERAKPSSNYGSVEESLARAQAGFERCREMPDPQPNPLTGINVAYFLKGGDGGRVEALLRRNHIQFTTRPGEYGTVSDTLSCTADVPVDQIKLLALLLHDAGIKLKSIQRHANSTLSKRLNIESGWSANRSDDYVPLTRDRIENLSECPEFEAQPIAVNIKFKNACSLANPYLFVRFYDSRRHEWATESFGRLDYGEEIVLADEESENYLTDRPFYFYAESPEGFSWPTPSAADRNIQLSDGRTVGFQKVRHTNTRRLTCRNLEN